MQFINVIDEQGRFMYLKVSDCGNSQADSHTYSYLGARNLYEQIPGEIMGFNRGVELEDIEADVEDRRRLRGLEAEE